MTDFKKFKFLSKIKGNLIFEKLEATISDTEVVF